MTTTLLHTQKSIASIVEKQVQYYTHEDIRERSREIVLEILEQFPTLFEDTFARPVGFTYAGGGPILILELPPVQDRATFITLKPSPYSALTNTPRPITTALNLPYPWIYLLVQISFPNVGHPTYPHRLIGKLAYAVHSFDRLINLDGSFNSSAIPIGSYLPNHRTWAPEVGLHHGYSSVCTNYSKNSLVGTNPSDEVLQDIIFDILANYLTSPYNTDYFYYAVNSLAFAMILRVLEINPDKLRDKTFQHMASLANERLRVADNTRKIRRQGAVVVYPTVDQCKDYLYILKQLEKNPDIWENPDLRKIMKFKQKPISLKDVFVNFEGFGAIYENI